MIKLENKINTNVTVETVKGVINQYIIKDSTGITAGRIYIIELSEENKFCSFRIKFYKNDIKYSMILKNTLNIILKLLILNKNINKVNTICDSNMDLNSFVGIGYELEGILKNSIYKEGSYKDEFIFGITKAAFERMKKERNREIQGNKIKLKVLTPADDEQILSYYIKNKEFLAEFEPSRDNKFYTVEMQKKILSDNYIQFLNGTAANFAIIKEEVIIGKIQLSNIIEGIFKNAFVGYSLDKIHQNKGYMTEALGLILKYAFDELDLHRIEASTLSDNYKSQAVLKACGFKKVGVNEKYLYIDGKWRDHISFYKLNGDG